MTKKELELANDNLLRRNSQLTDQRIQVEKREKFWQDKYDEEVAENLKLRTKCQEVKNHNRTLIGETDRYKRIIEGQAEGLAAINKLLDKTTI